MKRIARIAGAAIALPVMGQAAELQTGVGGYMNAGFGVANPVGTGTQFGVIRDGEVHFKVKGALDNGIEIEGRVELEAWTSSDQIDENWIAIRSDFGDLLIGGNDTAMYNFGSVGAVAPNGGYFNYYDGTGFVVPGDPGSAPGQNDSVGVQYSYEFSGLLLGAGYQPSASSDGATDSNNFVFSNNHTWSFGGQFRHSFGDFGFGVGGGYLWNDDLRQAHGGVELSYAGFTVAGFYDREERDPNDDLNRYGLGAQYETGPWTFGGGYTLTDYRQGRDNDNFAQLGVAYDLAPGVTLNGAGQWGEDRNDIDGMGGFTWMNVRF